MICVTLEKLIVLLRFPFCCLENESIRLDSIISKDDSHLVVGIKSTDSSGRSGERWGGADHAEICVLRWVRGQGRAF